MFVPGDAATQLAVALFFQTEHKHLGSHSHLIVVPSNYDAVTFAVTMIHAGQETTLSIFSFSCKSCLELIY